MSDNKAAQVVALFGGVRPMARKLNCDTKVIGRWKQRGYINPTYNTRVIETADREGIDRELLQGLLEGGKCPCCGQLVPVV